MKHDFRVLAPTLIYRSSRYRSDMTVESYWVIYISKRDKYSRPMCQHIGMLVYIFDLAYVIENRCSIIHSGLLKLLNRQTKYIYLFNIFQLTWEWYDLKKNILLS